MNKRICFLSIVVLAAGCIGQESPQLDGTQWRLVSYMNREDSVVIVLPNTEVSARFRDGTISGSAGCNSYSGAYATSDSTITIGPVAVTEMYCSDPEGIMEQEYSYLTALESARSYRIKKSTLEITNAQGEVVLTFTAA